MANPSKSSLSKSTLNVGVIGCGHIARTVHIPILLRHPRVKIVAVAEPSQDARENAVSRSSGIIGLEDYRDLLQMPEIDAVLICLPTALHAEAAVAALVQSKHIYLEKPVAASMSEADQVLDAWKRAGTIGMIGFNYRFNPLYAEAHEWIEAGRIGKIVAVRSVFAAAPHSLPEWKRTRATGGGALLDLASHHLDLLRFFTGREVESVSCLTQSQSTEDDTAMLSMRLMGGLLAQTFVSLSAAEEDCVEIYGEHGKLTVDRLCSVSVEMTGLRQAERNWTQKLAANWLSLRRSRYLLQKRLAVGWEPSYTTALNQFVAAALTQINGESGGISPDLTDGYQSLAVIAAAQESASTGQAVSPGRVRHENPSRQ